MKNVKFFFKFVLAGATLVTAGSTFFLTLRVIRSTKALGNTKDFLGFPDFSEDNSMASS